MRIHVIHHKPCYATGTIEKTLAALGAELVFYRTWRDEIKNLDPLIKEPVIFFGGPMGVYQADIFPFLNDEIEFLKIRLKADLPTLGICLGAQLMAQALGGHVHKGTKGPEIGWCDIQVTDDGKSNPMASLFDISQTKMIQWHGDTFELPDGVTLLASSPKYDNQIFSYGENAFALQCHPEFDEDIMEYWIYIGGFNDLMKTDQTWPDFQTECDKYLQTLKQQTKHLQSCGMTKRWRPVHDTRNSF